MKKLHISSKPNKHITREELKIIKTIPNHSIKETTQQHKLVVIVIEPQKPWYDKAKKILQDLDIGEVKEID